MMTTRLLMSTLTLSLLVACGNKDKPKDKAPDPVKSDVTKSDVIKPDAIEPDVIKPDAIEPEVAKPDPWALPPAPPSSVYSGPLFALSHAYPTTPVAPPADPPWRKASGGGLITTANAEAYTQALKDYVAADMKVLLYDYPAWDAGKAGWYNAPWLTSVREPIHGTYVGSSFTKDYFPISGLTADMTTHVLVYYDDVSAAVLQGMWGPSGMDPVPGIKAGLAQYPEGSIIVKPAFTTANATTWPVLEGAVSWPIYAVPDDGSSKDPVLQNVSFFQFDIIVKDSVASPTTQWVFTTLVYDKNAPGDNWDKMVALGAMWGNDPTVISPQGCDPIKGDCPALNETWINPAAPVYAKETLGWGGRLSGPNDGAVDTNAAVIQADGSVKPYNGRYAMSSCMSCHQSAEYPLQNFLLPSPSVCGTDGKDSCSPRLVLCEGETCTPFDKTGNPRVAYYDSGSQDFLQWFLNRPGTQAVSSTATALDFGMNNAFKALPGWVKATGGKPVGHAHKLSDYRGHPKQATEQAPAQPTK